MRRAVKVTTKKVVQSCKKLKNSRLQQYQIRGTKRANKQKNFLNLNKILKNLNLITINMQELAKMYAAHLRRQSVGSRFYASNITR